MRKGQRAREGGVERGGSVWERERDGGRLMRDSERESERMRETGERERETSSEEEKKCIWSYLRSQINYSDLLFTWTSPTELQKGHCRIYVNQWSQDKESYLFRNNHRVMTSYLSACLTRANPYF